jgi:hypothetical protein
METQWRCAILVSSDVYPPALSGAHLRPYPLHTHQTKSLFLALYVLISHDGADFAIADGMDCTGCAPAVWTCSTMAEFTALTNQVTAECCAEGCVGGLPTVCDAACSAVLLPFRSACEAGFLSTMPMGEHIVAQVDQAAALCARDGH